MAQFTRIQVAATMLETGLVPMFYHNDAATAKKLLKAVYDGGARLLEFTSRGDFAHEVFAELSKYATTELPGMILGVGSVTDAAAASLYLMLGANFIVTPVLREDIAIVCNRRKVLWSPGCGSLTDIARAEELGCEIIKLFPGEVYGPEFIAGVKGPQPWTNIMPTGGVSPTEESLKGWFDAGAVCVGIGSKLIKADSQGGFDYTAIEAQTKACITIIRNLKKISLS